jgi:hypothetical protein
LNGNKINWKQDAKKKEMFEDQARKEVGEDGTKQLKIDSHSQDGGKKKHGIAHLEIHSTVLPITPKAFLMRISIGILPRRGERDSVGDLRGRPVCGRRDGHHAPTFAGYLVENRCLTSKNLRGIVYCVIEHNLEADRECKCCIAVLSVANQKRISPVETMGRETFPSLSSPCQIQTGFGRRPQGDVPFCFWRSNLGPFSVLDVVANILRAIDYPADEERDSRSLGNGVSRVAITRRSYGFCSP